MILGHMKSIRVEGGGSLALFCAGQTAADFRTGIDKRNVFEKSLGRRGHSKWKLMRQDL